MDPTDRALREHHESFAGRHHASDLPAAQVRRLVADSWGRSAAAGLDPSVAAPMVFEPDELAEYRSGHPLAAVFPMLYAVLGRAAEDCDSVMAVGDSDGRLLWVCGKPQVISTAENIHFAEGAWWAERHVGTNALGTSLQLDGPVQIRSAEHFTVLVQPWSCAAAPIHDPETQRVLGVVDITGGPDAASPQSLGMVRAAARMAEAELGRLLMVRRTRDETRTTSISALGRDNAEVRVEGRPVRLSRRHSEIVCVLADRPAGLTADELAFEIYGADDHRSTLRGEITRLRPLLGGVLLDSRPYRFRVEVSTDWHHVTTDLDDGLVASALHRYAGPLLPRSDAPGVVARRNQLEGRLRNAVVASGDVDLLVAWTRSRGGTDDLEAWEHQLGLLSRSSPLRAMSQAEVVRLRAEYGVAEELSTFRPAR